ncbi:MAG TPA: TetR/AcrR family transcriptional regulator [Bacteroidales bacterium]|nr:TetR/AcrR family transcriptional regulator [Bacteroidales bacterium]HPM92798.1 TetR/AcrR family transcriptional regulator [Bacteroidales bacterium]
MTKDQTRDKILAVAAKMFGKYGFQKTTVDEIARTAHKAKGSVYYYYKSKEDLFLAVVMQEIQFLKTGLIRVIVDSQDATGMIRNYLMNRMMLMKDAVNYHESLKADFVADFSFLNDCREDFTRFEIDLMKAIIDRGIRENRFQIKDSYATAQVIILAMKAIEIPFYHHHKISEYEQTIVELVDILVRGLEKP